jgi:tol-pal system protein YbgF
MYLLKLRCVQLPALAATLVMATLLAGCVTTPEVDPVAVKLDDVDTRLGRVEAVVNNQSLVELSRRVDALETQLRSLRGGLEETQNSSSSLGKQQRDLYADLNKRIGALETTTKAATAAAAAAASDTADASAGAGGSDQAAYDRALAALRTGAYPEAIALLRDFGTAYPDTLLEDNAEYWLGEAYYVTGEYDQALTAFRAVGTRWPNSRKAPDALLKLGFTQQAKQDQKSARATLQQVVVRFPDSEAAKLAKERLLQLGAENR